MKPRAKPPNFVVATAPTVYGIETLFCYKRIVDLSQVATVLTVYGMHQSLLVIKL